jgi:Uma2 family endonuclease
MLQGRLVRRLAPLGGEVLVEASVASASGLYVADVAWASAEFMRAHGGETSFTRAPELCIEIASPSNSRKELSEKVEAYLGAGATEVWILYPQSKRCEFFGQTGKLESSGYTVDLAGLFD